MKNFTRFLSLSIFFISIFLFQGISTDTQAQSAKLSGNWLCQSGYGNVSLNFLSVKLPEYDGERYSYTVTGNTLSVNTETGPVQYPFQLDGSQLIIAFPEGYSLLFNKVQQSSANQNTGPAASPGGRYLKGTLANTAAPLPTARTAATATPTGFILAARVTFNTARNLPTAAERASLRAVITTSPTGAHIKFPATMSI